uniref:Uncharacterized protein n=1 Tax=Pectobacterium carotovorum TaxID=554 RepID=A0A0K0MPY0_PECCA|nr:hypothetical protein [Pectobacterium carotovorum]AKG47494.1 hypothetical protein pA_00054 [Pectobacterium carotovorum]
MNIKVKMLTLLCSTMFAVSTFAKAEFTESDFYWDSKISPYKEIIIKGVNKVHRENSKCKDIDPSSAYISGSKGTKANPVFYVTCGKDFDVFNVFFSKSDVENDKEMKAASHINKNTAVDLCESYAKSHTVHPSTLNFSKFYDLSVNEHANGRTTVVSSFSAKNSYNLELKYNIKCLLDAKGLIEADILERNKKIIFESFT